MRHRELVEKNLTDSVLDLFYIKGYNQKQISEELQVPYTQVYRFLRDHKLKNFNDEKLEALAMSDDFNPLNVISYYFQSVHHSAKELAFTGIVSEMLREKIAKVISDEGIESLNKGENSALLSQWYSNAQKMASLVAGAQKHLEGYIALFSQVLDVQREVSYVKVVTDILRQEDPTLYRKIQRALDADPEAKRVLESLSSQDVMYYWDAESGKVGSRSTEEVN
jgi:hypothetical protein